MVNFIKLIVFVTFILHGKCQKNKQIENEEMKKGVLINSQTKIYHIHNLRNNYIKAECFTGLLNSSVSSKYYRKLSSKSRTLLLKILVLVDYEMYQTYKNNLTSLYNYVITKWNNVDACFDSIPWPKTKLMITEIAVPMHLDVFVQPIRIKGEEKRYYPFNSTLDNMENWVYENFHQFEDLQADVFFFMSQLPLINDDYSEFNFYEIISVIDKFKCPKFGASNRILGGITFDSDKFGIDTARAIAEGLGVPYDEELGCGSEFMMTISEIDTPKQWSRCSIKKLKAIFRDRKFSCLRLRRHFYPRIINKDF